MRNSSAEKLLFDYIRGLDQVEGWLSPTTAYTMANLLWWQTDRKENGGVAEIGIHHGKSFLPLAIAAEPTDRLVAIDCFDAQEANADNSGKGDLDAFRANLNAWVPARKIDVIAQDSAEVRQNMAEHRLSRIRLFSVDGAHTKAMTRNDLEIANMSLEQHGVCVLDDFMNAWWTGVMSGFFDFCRDHHDLQPVALIPNKLVLARPKVVDDTKSFLRGTLEPTLLQKDTELADGTVDFYREFELDEAPWATTPSAPKKRRSILSKFMT